MRALALFALTLASVVSLTADASACCKRKKKAAPVVTYAAPACDPCGGAPSYYHGQPSYYGQPNYYGQPGYYHGSQYGHPGAYAVPTGPTLMPGAVVPGTMPPK
ncbi:hypothetical protein R5W24_004854 [Gemmata sp. JC717]|uniref:hypothetical protein n=1 Tax=Gemmata algarum TaxID=2975278 RepID=UPI0021BBA771|nr:hypothetical protein [Gemmata algarum]MDY3555709.1 hypothetical protein [Gemmata algarum]